MVCVEELDIWISNFTSSFSQFQVFDVLSVLRILIHGKNPHILNIEHFSVHALDKV